MRMVISHETIYHYDAAPSGVIQTLRLTPRNHDGQHVIGWRIETSGDSRLLAQEDAFGNITHIFTADGPFEQLRVLVEGEVETRNTDGVVRGTVERFPPSLYLRETSLTGADPAIRDFVHPLRAAAQNDPLSVLHSLLGLVHHEIVYDADPTHPGTTAAEAFALRRGVCQDLTHVFLAGARSLGLPARYVGGYMLPTDGRSSQEAGHAWAEVFVPDLGWVAFDPANGICATEAHVRVAVGLDYLGAAPVRGTRYGGAAEVLAVTVRVDQAGWQMQN
jgi:transglutaminase-like putative cysteine protease